VAARSARAAVSNACGRVAELQVLRQRLQHEATRVEREVVQYASLNEAARASMRTISEKLSF
jgi:hypothetical protein